MWVRMFMRVRYFWSRMELGVRRGGGGFLENGRGWFFLSIMLLGVREF